MELNKFDAIIFDFDGVIADTMTDNYLSWKQVLEEYLIDLNPLDYYVLEGMGRNEIATFFCHKFGLPTTLISDIVFKKEAYYQKLNNFRFYPEIEEILHNIKAQNKKIGLVTGASRDRIERTLEDHIKVYFDIIITVDDVTKGKPNPEPYLVACQKLVINPINALVIENAKLGIQSAKSAGTTCWALETTLDKSFLTQADEIFSNHNQLLKKIIKN